LIEFNSQETLPEIVVKFAFFCERDVIYAEKSQNSGQLIVFDF